MKAFKRHFVSTMALAVLASPMCLDQLVSYHQVSGRTIASLPGTGPSLRRAVDNAQNGQRRNQERPRSEQPQTEPAQPDNRDQRIQDLETSLAAEKAKSEELQQQVATVQEELRAARSSSELDADKINKLKEEVELQKTRVAELETKIAELTATPQDGTTPENPVAPESIEQLKRELEAAKGQLAITEQSLKDAQELLAKVSDELKAKEEELAKKEEELKKKAEELAKAKEEHDLYVCKTEDQLSKLQTQITDMGKQHDQYLQLMLGLNQMMVAMFQQNQQAPQMYSFGPDTRYYGMFQPYNPYAYDQRGLMNPSYNGIFNGHGQNLGSLGQQPANMNNYYGPVYNYGQGGMGMQQPSAPLMYDMGLGGSVNSNPFSQGFGDAGFYNFGNAGINQGVTGLGQFGNFSNTIF